MDAGEAWRNGLSLGSGEHGELLPGIKQVPWLSWKSGRKKRGELKPGDGGVPGVPREGRRGQLRHPAQTLLPRLRRCAFLNRGLEAGGGKAGIGEAVLLDWMPDRERDLEGWAATAPGHVNIINTTSVKLSRLDLFHVCRFLLETWNLCTIVC